MAVSDRCTMIVGFLVPHRCEETAIGACAKCARRYCQDHLVLGQAGLLCSACSEGRALPVALSGAGALDAGDHAAFSAAQAADADDDGAAFSDLS
jgi:hypothetical protein